MSHGENQGLPSIVPTEITNIIAQLPGGRAWGTRGPLVSPPLLWQILSPGYPLTKNEDEEVAHSAVIQFLQHSPKPRKDIMSRR
jgi:hypothetical protein